MLGDMANLMASVFTLTLVAVGANDIAMDNSIKTADQIFADTNRGFDNPNAHQDGFITTEYDMKLTPHQFNSLYEKSAAAYGPGASDQPMASDSAVSLWPQATMPYELDTRAFCSTKITSSTNLPSTAAKDLVLIKSAMDEISRFTCINFRRRTSADKNYVLYQSKYTGCFSMLGNLKQGMQLLNLESPGCRYRGLYVHETLHALGVPHEHQLAERDNYIDVLWQHVLPALYSSFDKYRSGAYPRHGVPYNYRSIMHYGLTAFTKDGSVTMFPKKAEDAKYVGKVYAKVLAYSDTKLLNLMYGCASHCSQSDQDKCGPNGHLDKRCQCICEDGSQDCDKTKSKSSGSCKNAYFVSWDCHAWAKDGQCSNSDTRDWMMKYCAKACGTCATYGQVKDTCINNWKNDQECERRAKRGDCITSPSWMLYMCHKSCNRCDHVPSTKAVCNNVYGNDAACDKWAREQQCEKNPKWMPYNCAKSCGTCGGTCSNAHKDDAQCDKWAREGECQKNERWMKVHCTKSCGACGGIDKSSTTQSPGRTTGRTPSTTPTTARPQTTHRYTTPYKYSTTQRPATTTAPSGQTTTTGPCVNKNGDDKLCEDWANYDQCSINPSYMHAYCAKTCKVCVDNTDSGSCFNKNGNDAQCDEWAGNAQCTKNPSYMRAYCAKSCKVCSTTATTDQPTATTATGTSCRDTNPDASACQRWAKSGQCKTSPIVRARCAKTCNACKTRGNCANTYPSDKDCDEWADTGHCETNPSMKTNCARSCNTCP